MSLETLSRPDDSPELPLSPQQIKSLGDLAVPDNLSELAQTAEEHIDMDYQILLTPAMRAEYISYTDRLIHEMAEQQTDVAIFLDKSARPVAWMVMELWDQLQPHLPNGGRMPRPQIKFLNIDKDQRGDTIGTLETGGVYADRIPKEELDSLKNIFKPIKYRPGAAPGEYVPIEYNDDDESMLTDKKVLIIDEVKVTGTTLEMAEKWVKMVYPDAKEIIGRHWMDGKIRKDPKTGVSLNLALPIWYQKIEEGRLVANRDAGVSADSYSQKQREGGIWLSRARGAQSRSGRYEPQKPDKRGLQLRADIKLMSEDLRRGDLPYIPSPQWDDDTESIDSRLERIMGVSVEEYVQLREEFWTYDLLCLAVKTLKNSPKYEIDD
jgi:hypothetical protein